VFVKLNRLGICVGPSEHGKSTIVRGEVLAHLTEHKRGLAFVHDPHGEYVGDICRGYASPEAARAALETNAPNLPRGFSIRGSSSAVRDLAVEIGKRRNSKDAVAVPIVQADDESSLLDSSSKTYITPEDLDLCSNRRHYGIYKILNVQSVRALTEAWFSNATDVWIFSQANNDDARELENRLGLPRGRIGGSRIMNAPKFKFLHWRRGEGVI
jgi:hypothetical protein